MREKVLEICKEVLPSVDFDGAAALIDDGILDSISIISLVSELSMEFDVEFDLNTLQAENMNSLDAIVETIKSLQE